MSIILLDFQCEVCHQINEEIVERGTEFVVCRQCGETAKKIISLGRGSIQGEEALWLKSVTEVCDKDSTKPETRAFMANPNRTNYFRWMKAEKIRPLEDNEHRGYDKAKEEKRMRDNFTKDYLKQKARNERIEL